jgi:hypothetical protein
MIYNEESIWARVVFFGCGSVVGQCLTALYEVDTGQAITEWDPEPKGETVKYPVFDLKDSKFGKRKLFLQFAGTPGTSDPVHFINRMIIMKKSDAVVICCKGDESQMEKERTLSELCNILERLDLNAEWTRVLILFQKQILDPALTAKVFIDGLKPSGRKLSHKDILCLENPSETYDNIIQTVKEFFLTLGTGI